MIRILLFYKPLLLERKMGPKKGRRVRKIEVPTDSDPEFKLGAKCRYTAEEGGEGGKRNRGRGTETK